MRVVPGVASPRYPAKLRPRGVRGIVRVSDDLCDWLSAFGTPEAATVVCQPGVGGACWYKLARLCVQITNATWSTPRMQATVDRLDALLDAAGSRAVWSARTESCSAECRTVLLAVEL
jgi:hypothetical protein